MRAPAPLPSRRASRRIRRGLVAAVLLVGAAAPPSHRQGRLAQGDPDVVAQVVREARDLLRADRPADAAASLRRALRDAPTDADAWATLGEAERKRCRLGIAATAFARTLETDPADPAARAGLAEAWLQSGEPERALATAQAGIDALEALGVEDGRPWRAKALALVELRRYDLAVAAGRRATVLRPDDARCAEAYAAALFRASRVEACRAEYLRAVALDPWTEEANLRLGNGFGPDVRERPWEGGPDEGDFRAAVAAWERGDLDDALARFLDLCERRPLAYKYRLGLGLTRVSLRRRGEAFLGGDPASLYVRHAAPDLHDLPSLVRGYERLGAVEAHVVRVAVAPSRLRLDAMRAAGATHEVVPLTGDVSDAPTRRGLRGKSTFDGRWYQHLRGVGGADGATGEEKLREAAEFAFNTFAHEWGHQVHRHGLSSAEQARVTSLYRRALAEGACLDYYAASDEDEYFAQGYEAFVSLVKRGCLPETARHTRAELRARDRPLYEFLRGVLDLSHEPPDAEADLLASARGEVAPRPEPSGR